MVASNNRYEGVKGDILITFGRSSPGNRQLSAVVAWLFSSPLFCILAALYVLVLVLDGMHDPIFSDEGSFLKNVCYFGVYRTAEPIYTNYPTFYSYFLAVPIYIVYFLSYVFFRHLPWAGLSDSRLFAVVFQGDIDIWLWVGRIISILFAVGTLALVYRYCVSYLSRFAGLVVISLLLFSPYNGYMLYARYALPDIPVAFLVTAILYLAVRYVETPKNNNLYVAGFLAGIASSAKLNGLLALVPLLASPWIRSSTRLENIRLMFVIVLFAILGFFVGSPYNIIKPDIYASGFKFEADILFSRSGNVSPHWVILALWNEDPAMTVLVIAAIVVSLVRHSKKDMIFHAVLIPAVIFLGTLAKKTPHYFLILFPWICIIIGEFFQEILKMDQFKLIRYILTALLIGLIAYEGHKMVYRVVQDSRPNNRILARDWIRHNISTDEHVLLDLDNLPRMGFIDLKVMKGDEYITKNKYPEIVKQYISSERYFNVQRLPTFDISIKDLKKQGWKYFVTANYCFVYYMQDPNKLDVVVHSDNSAFIDYLRRRIFYLSLFRESVDVKVFKDGSGPQIYIFRLL